MSVSFHIDPLNAEVNPISHLLTLLRTHHILHISRIRVNANRHSIIPLFSCMVVILRNLIFIFSIEPSTNMASFISGSYSWCYFWSEMLHKCMSSSQSLKIYMTRSFISNIKQVKWNTNLMQQHAFSSGPNKEMWWLTCNDNTCTSGRRTSFKYSWGWALAPETCRVTLQK